MVKVNGYEITEKEFDMALEERKYALRKNELEKQDVEEVADILIEGALMLEKAAAENITVSEQDIEGMISRMKQSFKSEEDFFKVLEKTGDDINTLRVRVERNLKLRNFVVKKFFEDTKVSDDDLLKYYEQYPERFSRGEEVRASHILFAETEKETALNIHEKLTEQNGDFAEEAKLYSICPSKENGGDLGYFDRGKMVPEFEQAAFATPIGEISDLIQSQFGYHIIKVTDKREGGKFELDEIREQLRQSMINSIVNHKIRKYTSELKEKADIQIDTDILSSKFPK
ncbi:MAG: peptidylprolyl isomerase [Candidatus Delongbacteria bacterium]|nr:peptidylprolyl isomerase [Candidatus Delongbacteria bacterium]